MNESSGDIVITRHETYSTLIFKSNNAIDWALDNVTPNVNIYETIVINEQAEEVIQMAAYFDAGLNVVFLSQKLGAD